jgi:Leucine-rich repeat (LRR) protein
VQLEGLYVAFNKLSGTVPDSIFGHTGLYTLSVSDNQLSGTIPMVVGNVGSLEALILGGNTFSGTIPDELYQCKSLFQLDLQDNQFEGFISPLFDELSQLHLGEKYVYPFPISCITHHSYYIISIL